MQIDTASSQAQPSIKQKAADAQAETPPCCTVKCTRLGPHVVVAGLLDGSQAVYSATHSTQHYVNSTALGSPSSIAQEPAAATAGQPSAAGYTGTAATSAIGHAAAAAVQQPFKQLQHLWRRLKDDISVKLLTDLCVAAGYAPPASLLTLEHNVRDVMLGLLKVSH